MRTSISSCLGIIAVLAFANGCKCPPTRVELLQPPYSSTRLTQMTVTLEPPARAVQIGQPFTLAAAVGGHQPGAPLFYEWQWNKAPQAAAPTPWKDMSWTEMTLDDINWLPLPGRSTNSNIYSVSGASTNDVAYYRVKVTGPGGTVTSKPTQIWVWKEVHSIIVYGTVVTQIASGGGCPGSYAARVDYPGAWPSASPYSARDQQRSTTWIRWYDYYYVGQGCDGGGSVSINVVYPTLPHYFTVYIPSPAPSGSYALYLQGFR